MPLEKVTKHHFSIMGFVLGLVLVVAGLCMQAFELDDDEDLL